MAKFKKGKSKYDRLPFLLGRQGAQNLPGSFGERRGSGPQTVVKGKMSTTPGGGTKIKKSKSVPKKVR